MIVFGQTRTERERQMQIVWYKLHYIGNYNSVSGTLTVCNIINDNKIIKHYANKRTAKQGFDSLVIKLIKGKVV